MSDPEVLDRILRSCDYRYRTMKCPHREKPANIIAAKWQTTTDRWTNWTIVDCDLLPAGQIWCDMKCLPQVESSSN